MDKIRESKGFGWMNQPYKIPQETILVLPVVEYSSDVSVSMLTPSPLWKKKKMMLDAMNTDVLECLGKGLQQISSH